jgi:hypothetical protein
MTTDPDDATPSDGNRPLSADEVCTAMADEHRRAVLRVLNRADGDAVTFDVLVDRVTDRIQADGDEHRRPVRTVLHHIHLPRLDEVGLIDHDSDQMRISERTGGVPQDLLAALDDREA